MILQIILAALTSTIGMVIFLVSFTRPHRGSGMSLGEFGCLMVFFGMAWLIVAAVRALRNRS
jgi:hypothetical protein